MTATVEDLSTADLLLVRLHLGGDRNFCYLIGDGASREVAAIDPAFRPERMAEVAAERDWRIRHILITHGHADHAAGAIRLAERTGAGIHAGAADGVDGAAAAADGARYPLGERAVQALHTPGHSPGHTCYLFGGRLLTGDILFCGKVGGTGPYFAGSSAEAEWHSLHRLLELPDETVVLPGHDYFGGDGRMPQSTIGHERRHNPFLLCADFAAFVELKATWAEYKLAHGIR